jgi:PAS domain S-box-containing protein
MTFTYQWSLVAFSVFIAIFSAYTTLRLAFRLAWVSRATRPYWIAGGACSMGIGIWAMHFVGMLAVHLPIPVAYDPLMTAFSLSPAILASAIALSVLGRSRASAATRFIASVLMGLGIVAMHYSGMAAMEMAPPIVYDRLMFILSLLVAVGASWVALHLSFREQTDGSPSPGRRLASAVLMGLAIAGMHYTGMAAAEFAPNAVCTVASSGMGGNTLGLFVGLLAVLVLVASLALTFYDELVGENSFYKALLAAQSDAGEGVLLIENDRVIYANPAMESLSGRPEAELKDLPDWRVLVEVAGAELLQSGDASGLAPAPSSGRREVVLRMRGGKLRTCEAVMTRFRHGEVSRQLLVCIDISERKAAQEALQAREALARELALVAARTDNAVIITNAQGLILWVNEGFERITGFSLDEALGKKPGQLLQGLETDPTVRRMIREQLARGEGFETEIVNYHKSGRKYWVAIDVKPVRDETGELVKFIAIERDITQRKLSEAAQRQSEARLNEAQQLARLGSWEFDMVHDEYILSDEALRIHEMASTTSRLPRLVIAAFVHPEDREPLRQCRAEAVAKLGTFSMQFRLVFPGGRIKHVHLRGTVHGDAQGNPVRVSGSIQDITEQKLTEQALRSLNETLEQRVLDRTHELQQQHAFIETILDTAEMLIFVIDTHGRFVRFNGACERLTGYRFEELRDQPIWEHVVPPERREAVQARHECLTSPDGVLRTLEVEWLTRDGQRRLISWSNATLTDETGRLQYMIGTGIDITERKRAESGLIEANRNLSYTIATLREAQSQLVLSEKMASLGALVAGISHEINTPVGIGVTSATTLQEAFQVLSRDFDGGTLKRSELARFIAHGLNGCDILVNNLLRAAELISSFKQVAVDQSSDEWRHINLHDYIDEIVLSLKPRLKSNVVQVLNASNRHLTIRTHPGAIYQILSNLLLNTLIHAYEPGQRGTIRIAAEQLGDEIQLDFADDGKGIAADIEGRIFDPFFTTRRGSGGSGLGLHIVYNLVSGTLGGVIHLVKNEGPGTTFRIRFPLHSQQEAA